MARECVPDGFDVPGWASPKEVTLREGVRLLGPGVADEAEAERLLDAFNNRG